MLFGIPGCLTNSEPIIPEKNECREAPHLIQMQSAPQRGHGGVVGVPSLSLPKTPRIELVEHDHDKRSDLINENENGYSIPQRCALITAASRRDFSQKSLHRKLYKATPCSIEDDNPQSADSFVMFSSSEILTLIRVLETIDPSN